MDTVAKHGKFGLSILGMAVSGILIVSNEMSNYVPMIKVNNVYPLATAILLSGIAIDILHRENEYEKLFRSCGIINLDGKIPKVIKNNKKGIETTLVVYMPEGISQSHFELKQQEIEQNLNVKIEFAFNKNLIMKLISKNLSILYNYVFEEQENPLQVYVGESYEGKFILDIEKCPHILLAGETNSGKTSVLDTIALSLILSKFVVDIHLIDFQSVGLGIFEDCKKVKSYGETPADFEKLLYEMEVENEKRLSLFRSVKNKVYIEKLSVWNKKFPERAMPYKVVIIDEFARLAEDEYKPLLEKFRTRISMDRKVGIHYIAAMQRPDVKCISGSIKANMPTRIAGKTVTQVDSEVILDACGAEKLKIQGRFLIKYCGEIKEFQALFIEPAQIRKFLKKNDGYRPKADPIDERKKIIEDFHKQNVNPWRNKK